MVFRIISKEDNFIENTRHQAIKDCNRFFNFDWQYNLPQIFLIPNRQVINAIKEEKTPDWFIGWTEGNCIFLLNYRNLKKESSHVYNQDDYKAIIRHEVCHCFYSMITNDYRPLWFNEGLAVYFSGQLNQIKRPRKFTCFLNYNESLDEQIYSEGGFAVDLLIRRFGSKKVIDFTKRLQKNNEVKELFREIFKVELEYETFQNWMESNG